MKDRVLIYAIVISAIVHLAAVCVIGRTSVARLDAAPAMQPPRLVRVDLVRDPLEEPKPAKPPAAKPAPPVPDTPKPKPPEPAPPAPRPETSPPPVPRPSTAPSRPVTPVQAAQTRTSASGTEPAGNPGGKLNIGSTSPQGDLPGDWNGGKTPVGWVPGADIGDGAGSGTGAGVGTPDPPKNADDGPGTRPAPEPTRPKTVSVRVCEASQMVAGKYCENVDTKSFVEGTEPRAVCDKCKPEPVHKSRLADRKNPELLRDCKVNTAALEEGLNVTIRVGYTVTEDGDVADAKIIKSSGDRAADRAVLNAASRLKYKPAVQNGLPRSVKMTRTYQIRT